MGAGDGKGHDGAGAAVTRMSVDELRGRLDASDAPLLIDVRSAGEFEAGHLPGAVNLPRTALDEQIAHHAPDKQRVIVVYCAVGVRSLAAATHLRQLGYSAVIHLEPGFERWQQLGYPVTTPAGFSAAQRERYARHLMLPEVGAAGQRKLLDSKVLVLGAGGLGSPAAMYLAAAGVGTIGLVDDDVVDRSNLQRQILHGSSRVGDAKVDSGAATLRELNPDVDLRTFDERLDSGNVERILEGFDLVVDGCDNFPTRYLVNDASVFLDRPVVHGSIFRFEGQVTVFAPGEGPCYRCLYPTPPEPHLAPSCAEAGVLGILPGVVGTLQATEAIKWLLGIGRPLVGRLLLYDSLRMEFRELRAARDSDCPLCGEAPTITSYVDYQDFCG